MTTAPFKKVAQIHQELRELVVAGEWPVGVRLPTETELAGRFECSVGTMNKAMALLAHEGLIERKARVGTRVLGMPKAPESRSTELDAFAFIYPSDQHEGIWRNLRGFQEVANQRKRRVVMLSTNAECDKDTEFLSRLQEFDVRGAVIFPNVSTPKAQVEFSQLIVNAKVPLVLISVNLMGLGRPTVVLDNIHAGYSVTRHLIEKGCRNIGFFSNRAGSMAMRDRYQGYRRAMEETGLPVLTENVVIDASMKSDFAQPLQEPTLLAGRYLSAGRKVDGVVCATDYLAYGMAEAAKSAGLRVPQDLKIVGIDGYYTPENRDCIHITTYKSPCEKIGQLAFETLEKLVSGVPIPPDEILVRGHIVVRDSS
ncbi:MAG: GntR family transcriptional regulator [Opitutaceae bacterium]|jgi:DNA-binding LacI/PurR family transcriptional regulator